MSILNLTDVNPNEVPELTPAPAGEEAELNIVSVLMGTDKNGDDYMMPFFEVVEHPNAPEFGYYLPLPTSSANEKENNKRIRKLKAFSEAIDIDLFAGEVDVKEELVGCRPWAILGIGKDRDGEPVNDIKNFVNNA